MGADFAMGPGLLCGFRRGLFAVGLADLGKRRRWVAFRADSACETAQKFAVHRWGLRAAVGRAGVARRAGYIDGFLTGAHEASPRSCGVLMTRWMLGMLYGRFLGYGVRRSAAGAHFADYLGDESSPKWWAN